MFSTIIKAEKLKSVVGVLSTIVDKVQIIVDDKGMTINAVDASHVAMLAVRIERAAFESYTVDVGDIGLDLEKVSSVLRLTNRGDVVEMAVDEDTGKVVFTVGSVTRRMAMEDLSTMGSAKMPALTLPSSAMLSVDDLVRGVRASEGITDHLSITISGDNGFELSCEGDTDAMSLKIPRTELKGLDELELEGSYRSLFPLDYFSSIVKSIPVGTDVQVHIGKDYPMLMTFDLDINEQITVAYLLAPRIEAD